MARRKRTAPVEVDFHGLSVAQVAARLEAVLRAHQAAGRPVHVVHGKGTGALADEVTRLARADPRVRDVYRSLLNDGVTVLELDPKAPAPARKPPRARYDDYREPPVRGRKR